MKRVVIIGAGLIGCFAARALSEYDIDITVLEQGGDVCTGISKAGTGIVYAGYDNKPGTLKSSMCISGNRNYEELCETLDVRYSRCGSLMLSYGPEADERIQRKLENGRIGGIAGLRLISRDEALDLEPHINPNISTALYSEVTGTVNPWELCIAAYECAVSNGVEFRFNETVCGLHRDKINIADSNADSEEQLSSGNHKFIVETDRGSFQADAIINCAGLNSDLIREHCERPYIRIVPTAADYLVTDKNLSGYINHIIFHEPETKSKGLTIVPTIDGNLLIGGTERRLNREHESLCSQEKMSNQTADATAAQGIDQLKILCEQIVPDMPLDRFIRSYACSRPNPFYVDETGRVLSEKKSISELKLIEENGLYSFIGVKTPGMTMAPELGRYVTDRILEQFGKVLKRSDYKPYRQGIVRPQSMPDEKRAAFISTHPEYGRIICRCEGISEGEIREAIRRGANTVEAVKRRTSSGMGRCQGSYCRQQIIQLLEEHTL